MKVYFTRYFFGKRNRKTQWEIIKLAKSWSIFHTTADEENLLEDTENVGHMNDSLQQLPHRGILCSRLKMKLVQDPLLDSEGKPFVESTVLR